MQPHATSCHSYTVMSAFATFSQRRLNEICLVANATACNSMPQLRCESRWVCQPQSSTRGTNARHLTAKLFTGTLHMAAAAAWRCSLHLTGSCDQHMTPSCTEAPSTWQQLLLRSAFCISLDFASNWMRSTLDSLAVQRCLWHMAETAAQRCSLHLTGCNRYVI